MHMLTLQTAVVIRLHRQTAGTLQQRTRSSGNHLMRMQMAPERSFCHQHLCYEPTWHSISRSSAMNLTWPATFVFPQPNKFLGNVQVPSAIVLQHDMEYHTSRTVVSVMQHVTCLAIEYKMQCRTTAAHTIAITSTKLSPRVVEVCSRGRQSLLVVQSFVLLSLC